MHRTFDDLLKISPNLVEFVEEKKKIDKEKDINVKTDFKLRVRQEIVNGIENGNFYDFDDAVNIANYFEITQCDWSHYGCSATDWEN